MCTGCLMVKPRAFVRSVPCAQGTTGRGARALKGREYSRCACLRVSRRFASSDLSSATLASSLWESATGTCRPSSPAVQHRSFHSGFFPLGGCGAGLCATVAACRCAGFLCDLEFVGSCGSSPAPPRMSFFDIERDASSSCWGAATFGEGGGASDSCWGAATFGEGGSEDGCECCFISTISGDKRSRGEKRTGSILRKRVWRVFLGTRCCGTGHPRMHARQAQQVIRITDTLTDRDADHLIWCLPPISKPEAPRACEGEWARPSAEAEKM